MSRSPALRSGAQWWVGGVVGGVAGVVLRGLRFADAVGVGVGVALALVGLGVAAGGGSAGALISAAARPCSRVSASDVAGTMPNARAPAARSEGARACSLP